MFCVSRISSRFRPSSQLLSERIQCHSHNVDLDAASAISGLGELMAHDESDSSDADSSYTATNVLLGYASKEPVEDTFSQLGGRPVISPLAAVPSKLY